MKRPGDIGDQKYCTGAGSYRDRQFGKLDIVVNNAGFQMAHESLHEIMPRKWKIRSKATYLAISISLRPACHT
jgi:NADP-dependent 3-hydroxy acid dehydrogenase YdfG